MVPVSSKVQEAIEAINLQMLRHHEQVEHLLERQALELPKILTQDLSESLREVVKQELEVLQEGCARRSERATRLPREAEATRLPREVREKTGQRTLKEAEAVLLREVRAEPPWVAPPGEVDVSPPTPAPPMMHPSAAPVMGSNVLEEIPESPAASCTEGSSKKVSISGRPLSASFHEPPPEAEEDSTQEIDQSPQPPHVPEDSLPDKVKEIQQSASSFHSPKAADADEEVETSRVNTAGVPFDRMASSLSLRAAEEDDEADEQTYVPMSAARSTIARLNKDAIAGDLTERVNRKITQQDRSSAREDDSRRCLVRRAAKAIVSHPKFDVAIAVLIILNAVQIGVETDWNMKQAGQEQLPVFAYLDVTFSFLFLIELSLRLCKDRLSFLSWHHKSFGWNVLDFFLCVTSVIEFVVQFQELSGAVGDMMDFGHLRMMRMARLTRILRIFKVVRFFSELRVMAYSVMMSTKSLMWALLLLTLVMFVFGVMMMQLAEPYKAANIENVDEDLEKLYGSLPRTIHTLFRSISGGMDWGDALSPLEAVSPIMEYLFSGYIFFTVFCCLNIVTGIFVDNAKTLKDADERSMMEESAKYQKRWIQAVADLFTKLASEHSTGVLSKDIFAEKLNDKFVRMCFKQLGIETETTTVDELWSLFDGKDWGQVDHEEFALGIKKFNGNARSIDVFKLRREIRQLISLITPPDPTTQLHAQSGPTNNT
eukprot:TRINITY_DN9074_c0_g1_i8.p1 TRINITY_DN9074_c0_g1~~TRINITY_DN9074_c0_g1_i8.p1  ORF type:complete len:722 (+),score=134.13 TRINITY_DN9074_c0_g1_i8:28-2166(+)